MKTTKIIKQDTTSGGGTADPSGTHEVDPGF